MVSTIPRLIAMDEATLVLRESYSAAIPAGGGDLNMNFRMNSTDTGAGTYSVFGSTDSTLILSLGGMYTLVEFVELTVRVTPAFF